MTIADAICPHCGCHSEDDEYCAACGRLFDEDDHVEVRKVSLLGLLRSGLRSLSRSIKPMGVKDLEVKEDPETCPSWSFLPNNIHHDDRMSNPAADMLSNEDL